MKQLYYIQRKYSATVPLSHGIIKIMNSLLHGVSEKWGRGVP